MNFLLFFKEKKGSPKLDINQANTNGKTALIYLIENKNISQKYKCDLIKNLEFDDSYLEKIDQNGDTAISMTISLELEKVFDTLIKRRNSFKNLTYPTKEQKKKEILLALNISKKDLAKKMAQSIFSSPKGDNLKLKDFTYSEQKKIKKNTDLYTETKDLSKAPTKDEIPFPLGRNILILSLLSGGALFLLHKRGKLISFFKGLKNSRASQKKKINLF